MNNSWIQLYDSGVISGYTGLVRQWWRHFILNGILLRFGKAVGSEPIRKAEIRKNVLFPFSKRRYRWTSLANCCFVSLYKGPYITSTIAFLWEVILTLTVLSQVYHIFSDLIMLSVLAYRLHVCMNHCVLMLMRLCLTKSLLGVKNAIKKKKKREAELSFCYFVFYYF